MIRKLKKILGVVARLLLAAGAEKWKEGQGSGAIKVQSLLSTPVAARDSTIVSPDLVRTGELITSPGPMTLLAATPAVVVSAAPAPYSFWVTLKKVGAQVWLLVVAALLDALLVGGALERLGLPPNVPIPFIYAVLSALRDKVRHPAT